MKFFRRMRRNWMRDRLSSAYHNGRRIAHLPAFLDRAPRHNLHRAIRSAFKRGFIAEQTATRASSVQEIQKQEPTLFSIPAYGPRLDEPNSEWDG